MFVLHFFLFLTCLCCWRFCKLWIETYKIGFNSSWTHGSATYVVQLNRVWNTEQWFHVLLVAQLVNCASCSLLTFWVTVVGPRSTARVYITTFGYRDKKSSTQTLRSKGTVVLASSCVEGSFLANIPNASRRLCSSIVVVMLRLESMILLFSYYIPHPRTDR